MDLQQFRIRVAEVDPAAAAHAAADLADVLREVEGVTNATRSKDADTTMDLGAILTIALSSAAIVAIAKGLADWLRARRGTSITIERDGRTGSIKAAIAGIDPDAALRITEVITR